MSILFVFKNEGFAKKWMLNIMVLIKVRRNYSFTNFCFLFEEVPKYCSFASAWETQ